MTKRARIYLSPPHLSGAEIEFVADALASNWVAPAGPHLGKFEDEFANHLQVTSAAALSSGTAALHLALKLLDVGQGDEVFVSTLTFAASVFPIRYVGATPVFIDSERESWNMDPRILAQALDDRERAGRLPRAVIVVHLYGQSANLGEILPLCAKYGVPVIEDAAEALGSRYGEHAAGTQGQIGIFSFNGNKTITTSSGGMLTSNDGNLVERARHLASQAREVASHYEHNEIGYNYRLSNVLAAIGRAQLRELEYRVDARRRNYDSYREALADLPGISFMPEAPWGRHSRWLTAITIDPELFGADRETVRLELELDNIDSRPIMKPMHLQPVFSEFESFGGPVAEDLFDRGLCLPSGSNLEQADLERVVEGIRAAAAKSVKASYAQ